MATIARTGRRRHYQVVDHGESQLREVLELAFTEDQQPTFFVCTDKGVFASSQAEALDEHRQNDEEVHPLSAGDYCRTVASGAIDYFRRLTPRNLEFMIGSWPISTGDNPQVDGWSLMMHGRDDGVLLVQIKPAWWS